MIGCTCGNVIVPGGGDVLMVNGCGKCGLNAPNDGGAEMAAAPLRADDREQENDAPLQPPAMCRCGRAVLVGKAPLCDACAEAKAKAEADARAFEAEHDAAQAAASKRMPERIARAAARKAGAT